MLPFVPIVVAPLVKDSPVPPSVRVFVPRSSVVAGAFVLATMEATDSAPPSLSVAPFDIVTGLASGILSSPMVSNVPAFTAVVPE